MSIEENKDTIRRMFKAQLANDMVTYRQILADDLKWEIMQVGIDQPRGKEEMIAMLQLVHKSLGGGKWDKQVVSMVGEGDRLAVEATATMELRNGSLYDQRYHYVYVFRNGQVVAVKEYCDTLNAANAFKGLPPVAEAPK